MPPRRNPANLFSDSWQRTWPDVAWRGSGPREDSDVNQSAPDLRAIFGQALELDSPAERARYLTRICGEDAALRREVESLLQALGEAGEFLESPAPAPTVTR